MHQDILPLFVANIVEQHYGHLENATQRRIARYEWLNKIKTLSEPLTQSYWGDIAPGTMVVALCTWSRDCDMCESTSRRIVVATSTAVQEAMDRDFDSAEGPINHWLQSPSDEFNYEVRDRALEAFENGHPYSIY